MAMKSIQKETVKLKNVAGPSPAAKGFLDKTDKKFKFSKAMRKKK